jgi:hypothetical protein
VFLKGQIKNHGERRIAFAMVLPPLSALPERFAGPADTPDTVRGLRVAPSVGCTNGNLSPVGMRTLAGQAGVRWSVLLPERSDRCNQPPCAFGGFPGRKLSPDRLEF